jgi:septum formation inhibitor-activating ATPase MinD
VSKGCPQGSFCGPGFWNIQYNSLLNLKYGKRTKAMAFADDLLIAVRAENVQEAENFANIEIGKISNWAKENKITFNEQKSKVMLVTRRKRREKTEVNIYLNTKPLEQVNSIKYLGIIIDSKMHFREHIISTAKKCTTLIHTLAKSAKLNWGLKHEALNTI